MPMVTRHLCEFLLHQERFLPHYHRRSNVETVFAMIKAKFGAAVRSRLAVAQINEVLAKCVAHNLCCGGQGDLHRRARADVLARRCPVSGRSRVRLDMTRLEPARHVEVRRDRHPYRYRGCPWGRWRRPCGTSGTRSRRSRPASAP